MHTPLAIYFASFLGAVALWMMMPAPGRNLRRLGGLVGLAVLAGLWLMMMRGAPTWHITGIDESAFIYYYVFSLIAIVAAVRVITNQKPVYAALWFVMVVLATAGLFLVLAAEFMAFALVIIYGGAILVTYMFVIMLASHSGDTENRDRLPVYDRYASEPLMGIAAGFVLLAVLLNVAFLQNVSPNPRAAGPTDPQIIYGDLAEGLLPILGDRAAGSLADRIRADAAGATPPPAAAEADLNNVERIGLDLFRSHPLGLELAGVILLVALIGAVVIAKTRVPGEDETAAAG